MEKIFEAVILGLTENNILYNGLYYFTKWEPESFTTKVSIENRIVTLHIGGETCIDGDVYCFVDNNIPQAFAKYGFIGRKVKFSAIARGDDLYLTGKASFGPTAEICSTDYKLSMWNGEDLYGKALVA